MRKKDMAPYPALFPNPAVLVSCGPMDAPNIITLAWTSTVCREPPMVGIAVTPTRQSYDLLVESKDFVINIPTCDQAEIVDLCGNVSGKEHDKFKLCGLTPEPATKVNSPRIKECPISIECYISQIIHLGSHDLFIGDIATVAVDPKLLSDGNGIDIQKMKTLVYAQGYYFSLGELIGKYGYSQKKDR